LNLQLPVTPEMDQLTVGGLCLGYGIESSSHVVGLFFEASVIEVEVVTASGDILLCSATNAHEDLFRALQWSYGTLGFAVTFKLRLIDAKPFIKLTLERVNSYDEAEKRSVADVSKKNPHYYYEGLAFGPKHTALIYGDVIDTLPPGAELYNPMKRWWEPFFHRYVEQKTANATGPVTVYMPLRDYLHRYYRGLFWEVELLIPGANTYLFRLLFGWLCPPHTKHLKMLQTEEMFEQLNKDHIVQDVLVPVYELASTLRKCDEWFDIYPLWFVFHTAPGPGDMMRPDPRNKNGLFVDVGIWGVPARVLSGKDRNFDGEARTRDLEAHLRNVTGLQTLYAATFQSEEQFNQMYDLSHYKRMRVKYNAENTFPTVYDKVRLRRS
jgi:delta24-sterol reductase